MAELLQLVAGSEVRCTDGRVGHVRGLIFDPQAGAITHLSFDASSPLQNGRIIPVSSVESGGSVIELGCARDHYYTFPENEAMDVVAGPRPTTMHVHLVPQGESQISIRADRGRVGPAGANQSPNQRARLVDPNSRFSAANSADG